MTEGRTRRCVISLAKSAATHKMAAAIGQARRSEIILAKTRSKPPCRRGMGDCLMVEPGRERYGKIGGLGSATGVAELEKLRHFQYLPARPARKIAVVLRVSAESSLYLDILPVSSRYRLSNWRRCRRGRTDVWRPSAKFGLRKFPLGKFPLGKFPLGWQILLSSKYSPVSMGHTSDYRLNGCVR
jgi:hypothetical protein